MYSNFIDYRENDLEFEGFTAYPHEKRHPLVILCHAWSGRDTFICDKARELAKEGYAAFALDMYGKGILGKSKEENMSLKRPLTQDRYLLQRRMMRAFEVASQLPYVDVEKIAVLGFGFGGICALDLARSGVIIRGAISIYGHLDPPPIELIKPIQAKVLILHGYRDPLTSQAELSAFEKEMDRAAVDWQMHIYGEAMHAFATPGANDYEAGILYHPVAAKRAWRETLNFLQEIFN